MIVLVWFFSWRSFPSLLITEREWKHSQPHRQRSPPPTHERGEEKIRVGKFHSYHFAPLFSPPTAWITSLHKLSNDRPNFKFMNECPGTLASRTHRFLLYFFFCFSLLVKSEKMLELHCCHKSILARNFLKRFSQRILTQFSSEKFPLNVRSQSHFILRKCTDKLDFVQFYSTRQQNFIKKIEWKFFLPSMFSMGKNF